MATASGVMDTQRSNAGASLAISLLIAAVAAGANGPVEPVNMQSGKLAVKGYDTVAYFRESRAVKGSSEHTAEWMGAKWHFSSAANRDEFQKSPEQYAPQFGGYCAWAVGHNYTAPVDLEAWKIVDGKLYLNYNKSVQRSGRRIRVSGSARALRIGRRCTGKEK